VAVVQAAEPERPEVDVLDSVSDLLQAHVVPNAQMFTHRRSQRMPPLALTYLTSKQSGYSGFGRCGRDGKRNRGRRSELGNRVDLTPRHAETVQHAGIAGNFNEPEHAMTAWGRHAVFAVVLVLAVSCASVMPKKSIADLSTLNGTWRGKGSSAEMVEWRIMGDRYEATMQRKSGGR
jgi:hypothetical protein